MHLPEQGVKTEAPNGSAHTSPAAAEADMAQAIKELARGEQQAAALERNLTSLENRLDALLAQFEDAAKDAETPVKKAPEKNELFVKTKDTAE